jgi:Uma2 family endonuclease
MRAMAPLMTFAEFEKLPDAPGKRELLDGELIESPPARIGHIKVQHHIADLLRPYGDAYGLSFFVEAGFRLGKREWVQPDVSVVTPEHEERSAAADPDGYFEDAPFIAIEVISATDTAEFVERKLFKYFENGAMEVWVADPKMRHIWRHSGLKAEAVVENGVFTSPLLPGFEMDVAEIFRGL